MGPFGWLKKGVNIASDIGSDIGNAVSTGVSDVGHAISTGVGNVEHAIGINNGPSQSQTGSVNIAQPTVKGANLTNIANANQPASTPNQVKPPTPFTIGVAGTSPNPSISGPNIKSYMPTANHQTAISPNSQLSQVAQNKGIFGQPVMNLAHINQNTPQPTPIKGAATPADALRPAINAPLQIAKNTVMPIINTAIIDPAKEQIAQATGNKVAQQNAANEKYQAGQQTLNIVRGLTTRPAAELALSLNPTQQTFTPNTPLERGLFGSQPVQNIEKKTAQTAQQKGVVAGIGEAAGSIIQDIPVAGGVIKVAAKGSDLVNAGRFADTDIAHAADSLGINNTEQTKPTNIPVTNPGTSTPQPSVKITQPSENLAQIQNTSDRPQLQQQLEDAHNKGDVQMVNNLINQMGESDPYKRAMQSVFADDIKNAQTTPIAKEQTLPVQSIRPASQGTPLYDPRNALVQRGESGQGLGESIADIDHNPREAYGASEISPEEFASLQKTAPQLTMQDIEKAKSEDAIPFARTSKELLQEADSDTMTLLEQNGNRKSAIANYVEHYGMTKPQAEHRTLLLQREVNMRRSSPNPLADKLEIPEAQEGDIRTPAINARNITNTIALKTREFNKQSNGLDQHDVALLDKLRGNKLEDVVQQAHNPSQFKTVAEAAKDYNDYTHAVGYKLGQDIPYRQEYGARLKLDLGDPASREAFMKVAKPTDKGYTLPRNIENYEQAAAYGIKRKNANFLEDVNQDAVERSNDLRKLAVQQGLEQAFPGKVAVGEIARDAETGKTFTQLNVPGGKHLSVSPEVADLVNNRTRIETAPDLGVAKGNVKGAIAKATGMADEVKSRFDQADYLQNKLSDNDKKLLYRYDNGEPLDQVAKDAEKPEQFTKAVNAMDDALTHNTNSIESATGNTSLHQPNEIPHYFQASEDQMNKLDIPQEQRLEDGSGFMDTRGKYKSYIDAKQKDDLNPLYPTPFDAVKHYAESAPTRVRNQALFSTLSRVAPQDIAELGIRSQGDKFLKQAPGGLPFNVSDTLEKSLTNFKKVGEPKSVVGQKAMQGVKIAGSATKKALFLGSPFHQVHISENVAFASLMGGKPRAFGEGLLNEAKAKGGISKSHYYDMLNSYREDGTLEYARNMGLTLPEHSGLDRFINSYALSFAKGAKDAGIKAGTQQAIDLGRIYNHILGRENAAVEAVNPFLERMGSYFSLAPHYLKTQLKLVYEAFAPKKLGGAGYDRPLSLLTPGGAARSAVLGPRVFGALAAVTASAIIMQRFPTWQQAVNEMGLNPNNTNPNVDINSRNSKGEKQVMNLPTDPAGLAFGLLTDPKHFLQSRESPALSFGTKVATNTNWNGQPLTDTNKPNQFGVRLLKAGENTLVPIGIQNFTNLQHNQNNPNIEQGIAQEVGLRLKTNPNDPQVKANKDYFNTFNQVSNALKNSGQFGQYWASQFAGLHPANTTDASGQKYPTPYEPLSSEKKYAAYVDSSSGTPQLSPVFDADKKLNNATPGYPSSPLYKLNGTGTAANGQQSPQALVALEYQHIQDPAAKTDLMNANGGKNGWLAKYEGDVGNYSQNYQKDLTDYFQNLGWTQKAVDTYWQSHPSSPDPIASPSFDKPTTDLMNQYYALSASGDSTSASKFFSQNADVLGGAFDQLAQHANALRQAKGELELQGYPTESGNVKQILNSMPSGSDSASKKARAQLINNNPDVSQYLADIALYETLDKGAQFRYVNPANTTATQGQNINAGGQSGQTFLKDVTSLGKYDIGKNAAGNYQFMQGGAFSPGYASSSGSSSSSKKAPLVPLPPRPKRPSKQTYRRPHLRKVTARNIHLKKTYSAPIRIKHAGPLQPSHVIKIAA